MFTMEKLVSCDAPIKRRSRCWPKHFFKASQNIKIAELCGVSTAKCRSKSLKFKKGKTFEERGSSLSSSKENLEKKSNRESTELAKPQMNKMKNTHRNKASRDQTTI
jgi:hypothetical protein